VTAGLVAGNAGVRRACGDGTGNEVWARACVGCRLRGGTGLCRFWSGNGGCANDCHSAGVVRGGGSYLGHPYFVTGNALFNAIARRVDERTRRALHVSHGVFVPGEFGEYPRNTRRTGTAGNSGSRFPMSRRTRICSCSVTRSTGGCWIRGREMRTTRTISSVTVTGWRLRRRVSLGDRRSSEIRSGRCRGSCTATCTGGAMMTSCRSLETCLTGSSRRRTQLRVR